MARIPVKVKLFVGLLSHDTELFARIPNILEKKLKNKVDLESAAIDFENTDYYKEEMGASLKRKFLGFEKLVDLRDIYKTKLVTNKIEKRFSVAGKRAINIDPGYLDLSKVVLFSTKDYSHRIYINKGIFAEVTLFYKDKAFRSWPWTYPDYKTEEYISIFSSMRELYKKNRSG